MATEQAAHAGSGSGMDKIIKTAVERGASDLHMKAGDVFRARINGKLVPLTKQRLTPDQTRAIALKLISSEEARGRIDTLRDFDCSWGLPGVGRFRVNVLRQRSSFMIVMRVIPFTVPTIEALKLPDAVRLIAESDRGLVLVTGVSGSGKSSTVAAMVHHINRTQHKHVVTIENPIEFLHRDLNCSITQREVGVDTETFSIGLRAALRQDPDVVVIGEMTDAETIDTAIKAAETGRLVIASLSTSDVTGTVERVIATLPHEEREVGRMRFAEALRAILAQRLLPSADESGRVAAVELLAATPEVRGALKDPARLGALRDIMARGAEQGMQTFEQSVALLLADDRISAETAEAATVLATLAPGAAAVAATPPPAAAPKKGSRATAP